MTPNAQPTRVESFDRSALAQLLEPPYTDPYVRWCGRGGAARLPPIPIIGAKRPFGEPTIKLEAKAWLTSLSCRKAKELGYPHELWTTRLLARLAREHGPAEGHPCLANTKMAVARVAAPDWSCTGLKGRGRKSSPSSVRMSKAYSWTLSSCLRECRALKSGTPSTPRMTASPSTNAQHRGQRKEFCKRLRSDRI